MTRSRVIFLFSNTPCPGFLIRGSGVRAPEGVPTSQSPGMASEAFRGFFIAFRPSRRVAYKATILLWHGAENNLDGKGNPKRQIEQRAGRLMDAPGVEYNALLSRVRGGADVAESKRRQPVPRPEEPISTTCLCAVPAPSHGRQVAPVCVAGATGWRRQVAPGNQREPGVNWTGQITHGSPRQR